jgi:hypothetical protein
MDTDTDPSRPVQVNEMTSGPEGSIYTYYRLSCKAFVNEYHNEILPDDGVNTAARLQAEPGGIVVSGTVYDQVHNKLSVGFVSASNR